MWEPDWVETRPTTAHADWASPYHAEDLRLAMTSVELLTSASMARMVKPRRSFGQRCTYVERVAVQIFCVSIESTVSEATSRKLDH